LSKRNGKKSKSDKNKIDRKPPKEDRSIKSKHGSSSVSGSEVAVTTANSNESDRKSNLLTLCLSKSKRSPEESVKVSEAPLMPVEECFASDDHGEEDELDDELDDDENLNVCDDSMDYNDLSSENEDLHSSFGAGSGTSSLMSPGAQTLNSLHSLAANGASSAFPEGTALPANFYSSFFGAGSASSLGGGYFPPGWPHFALPQNGFGNGFASLGLGNSKCNISIVTL
jgi:hypothetical protein